MPYLWVVPRDLIIGTSAEALAQLLQNEAGCDTWVLDGDSLAYSFRDILCDRGTSLDYPKFLEKTRVLDRLLSGKLAKHPDAMDLDVPDQKFWTRMSLAPDEAEGRDCCYMLSTLEHWGPFTAFKAAACHKLTSSIKKNLRSFFEEWIMRMSSQGAQGEVLKLADMKLEEYFRPPAGKFYPWDGFLITCSSYVPCTWPWLELYLSMRKHLPPRQRLSLEFFDPVVGSKWL